MLTRLRLKNPLVYPGDRLPGFDPSHPASNGITPNHGFVGVAAGGPNGFKSVLDGKQGANTGSITYGVFGNIGQTWRGFSNNCGTAWGNKSGAADQSFTLATIGYVSNAGAVHTFFFTDAPAASGGCSFGLTSGGAFAVTVASSYTKTLAQTTAANVPYFFAVSVNTATSTINSVKTDLTTGRIFPATTTQAGSVSAPHGTYQLGIGTTAAQLSGAHAAILFSPTFLSQAQLAAFAADPWSFWYPPRVEQIIGLSLARSQIISPPKLGTWVVDWS